jgi:hypothetical protein
MSKLDDLLQEKLEALEDGRALDEVLAELPEEARELGALISLASTLQTMAHPEPQIQSSLAALQSASVRKTIRPTNWRRPVEWAWPRLAYAPIGVGVTLVLLIALVALSAFGLWIAGPRAAHVVTAMDVVGVVGVGPDDSNEGWELVNSGFQVKEGQRLRTGTEGSVTLVFFDGTRNTLGPDTDLTLSEVDGGWGNVLQVELSQQSGDTNHSVVPFQGKKSAYLVHTPSGTVSVHGTVFDISVDEMGQAHFVVDRGEVMVTGQDSEVVLKAGQATNVQPGGELENPSYQFKLEGILTDVEDDTWAINDVAFQVTSETQYEGGDPVYGAYAEVKGHVGEGGVLVADKVEVSEGEDVEMSFTGVVDSIGTSEWVISGKVVLIKSFTDIDPGIEAGDTVRVTFIVGQDEAWEALRIKSLEEEAPDEPQPVEADIPATEEVLLETDCTGANPHPKALALAGKYAATDEEIMGWFCQGFGFGEVDLAYGLSEEHDIPVTEIFAMRMGGAGWGKVKKNPPIPSVTVTDTTVEVLEIPEPVDETEKSCMGKEAKKGQNMANRLGVGIEMLEHWYCQEKHTLNDVEHAFGLSRKTGATVQRILDMRSVGLNWGQIQKELSPKPDPKPQKTKKPK